MKIKHIYDACCKANGINISDKCRKREYAYARFVFYKLCKENIKSITLSKIGSKSGRDHASVIHGLKQYEKLKGYEDFDIIDRECREMLSNYRMDLRTKEQKWIKLLDSTLKRLQRQLYLEKQKNFNVVAQ